MSRNQTSTRKTTTKNVSFLVHWPSMQGKDSRPQIITCRRKVSVLGLVTKSILKVCIWQQLGVLGRAFPLQQERAAQKSAVIQ